MRIKKATKYISLVKIALLTIKFSKKIIIFTLLQLKQDLAKLERLVKLHARRVRYVIREILSYARSRGNVATWQDNG